MSHTPEMQNPPSPPKMYRVMRCDPLTNLPVVGSANSSELGARLGIDIRVDAAGDVILDGKSGMSVNPDWRDIQIGRIPKRLRHIVPGAKGNESSSCFSHGSGPFQSGSVTQGLELIPDQGVAPVTHGVVAPRQVVPFTEYQTNLANTQFDWKIDET